MTSTHSLFARVTTVITMLVVLTGCGNAVLYSTQLYEEKPKPVPAEPLACDANADLFNQDNTANEKKVDLVFVIDTSSSLREERNTVATGIDDFIKGLGPDVDYQIAVVFAHGKNTGYAGKLYRTKTTEPFILRSKDLTQVQIRETLRAKMLDVKNDTATDGGEAGMYSTLELLTDASVSLLRTTYNFLRTDAALAFVYVADENDVCSDFPAGVTPVRDPTGNENRARAGFCREGNYKYQAVYARMKQIHGTKPLVVSSIIYTSPETTVRFGENETGYGYKELTQLNNGLLVGIKSNIAAGLEAIGRLTVTRLVLKTEFVLSKQATNQYNMKVYVDDVAVPFAYSKATNKVVVSENVAGQARSVVKVDYCVQPDDAAAGDGKDAGVTPVAADRISFSPAVL